MKQIFNNATWAIVALFSLALASCKNDNQEFPDYEGGTSVYFAHQAVERTLVLGYDEENANALDRQHKCQIISTMGGSYGGADIMVNVAIDNSLCENLYFSDGSPVVAMPSDYYQLGSTSLNYGGSCFGRLEVQFTDAFFSDPKALTATYVIPVVIKNQTGAGRILSGTPLFEDQTPVRTNSELWSTTPQDYVLYCVKYVNPYHGYWLRRGVDQIAGSRSARHASSVEKDEICTTVTTGLSTVKYVTASVAGKSYELQLTFASDGTCSVSSLTSGVTASGTGHFGDKTEKKAWGNKDRDAIYLDYTINDGSATISTQDTLVWQRHGVSSAVAEFSPVYKGND